MIRGGRVKKIFFALDLTADVFSVVSDEFEKVLSEVEENDELEKFANFSASCTFRKNAIVVKLFVLFHLGKVSFCNKK